MDELVGVENKVYLMNRIREALNNTKTLVPIPGKYYTFVYNAKTPGILYDQHPLIYCEDISISKNQNIYFNGINYHFPTQRVYRIDRVDDQLYEFDAGELADLREIPYALFLNT